MQKLDWALLGMVSVCLFALGLLVFLWIWSPMRTIGTLEMQDGGRMEVASQHDGDISTEIFYRVTRKGSAKPEWSRIGWTTGGISDCITASTPDGRFFCIASPSEVQFYRDSSNPTFPLMILHDRKTNLAWPSKASTALPDFHWDAAWKLLRASHPELPPPSI